MSELPTTCPLQAEEWDRFLEESRPDIGYLQSSMWAAFLVARGWRHFGTVFKERDAIVGGASVLSYSFQPGKCFYYIPEGPVLPTDGTDAARFFKAITDFVDEKAREDSHAVSHLRIEPRWETRPEFVHGCREADDWMEPRDTLQVDLSRTEEEILAQMKPKGRYNVRVARRHGVSVVEDRSRRGLEDFLELYKQTYTRHGLARKRSRYFRQMHASLPSDRMSIFFAEYKGMRLATALVSCFGERAAYLYGGSRDEHRRTMAPYLLHFETMLRAKSLGRCWYDFTGIAPPNKLDHSWSSFSTFKRKFGGVELHFVPTLDFIYDPLGYVEYLSSR